MAPNKRGGPLTSSVISKDEVAARGAGTKDAHDVYSDQPWQRSEIRVMFTGLMFLTRLPCPAWVDHHPALLMRSMCWFPLIGVLIGAWGAAFFSAAAVLWPPSIAAAVSTMATVWLTGAFHEDGLADVFDGFGGGWGKVQILRIMKDSRVGTYALVGMSLVLHAKLQALAMLSPADAWPVMVVAHCASRWTCVPLVYCCTYIQDDEDAKQALYNWYAQSQRLLTSPRLTLATVVTAAVPLLMLGPAKALAVYATLVIITAAAGYYGTAIIGGVVGDFLGATIQVAELAIYCVLLADWSAVTDGGWVQLAMLGAVVLLPVMYCRRIVDFGRC